MRLKIILPVMVLLSSKAFSQTTAKQVLLPLSNVNGVPFYSNAGVNYLIDGFEIDSNENFYFISKKASSGKSVIVKFSDNKFVYNKSINLFVKRLYAYNKNLYTSTPKSDNILIISAEDGAVKMNKPVALKANAKEFVYNGFVFSNNNLVAEYIKYGRSEDLFLYQKYTLDGAYVSPANNAFALTGKQSEYLRKVQDAGGVCVGSYNQYAVFLQPAVEGGFTVSLCSAAGKELVNKLPGKYFGDILMGDDEFMKLRNGRLYFLTKKSSKALVTSFELSKLFSSL